MSHQPKLSLHTSYRHWSLIISIITMLMALPLRSSAGKCNDCDDCYPRIALKTNLVSDALLTPDLGIELNIGKRFSIGTQWSMAWWSNTSRHRFWRFVGGTAELRVWPGNAPIVRALTGHHVGIYASAHTFDFEFGGKGWQSPKLAWGCGAAYGYSFKLNGRLNLDVSCHIGYWQGDITTYRPQCGVYNCINHKHRRYFGLTALEITLMWFPGRNNHPEYAR